jgi:hypothetical protein
LLTNFGAWRLEKQDSHKHNGVLRFALRPPQVSQDSSEGNTYTLMGSMEVYIDVKPSSDSNPFKLMDVWRYLNIYRY